MENEFTISNEDGLILTFHLQIEGEEYNIMYGGRQDNPNWEEYLDDLKDEYKPHFELLKKGIDGIGWVGETADKICNDFIFKFSDGFSIGFTWRAWGDLMQAIVGKREGYMKYYMNR